jgi:hypothetical protein
MSYFAVATDYAKMLKMYSNTEIPPSFLPQSNANVQFCEMSPHGVNRKQISVNRQSRKIADIVANLIISWIDQEARAGWRHPDYLSTETQSRMLRQ